MSGSAMQRTLSKQGARRTKLTVLIPDAVMDDLRALRMYTCQSTGDLINQLIEREIESNPDAIREGRKLLAIEQDRQKQAMARREAARSPPSPEPIEEEQPESSEGAPEPAAQDDRQERPPEELIDPRTRITLEDVAIWSQEGAESEAPRRLSDGEEFVKWLMVEGRSGTLKDADDFAEMYMRLHEGRSKGTLEKHTGRVRSLARWWAKNHRGRHYNHLLCSQGRSSEGALTHPFDSRMP